VSKWVKIHSSKLYGSIYGEKEAVVYIYSIGRVKYYNLIPRIYKEIYETYK
jgi:hypothetical protein